MNLICKQCGCECRKQDPSGKCVHCGGSLISYYDAFQEIGKLCGAKVGSHGVSYETIEEGILDWRARCYESEKWLSRLLQIGLNQVVREAGKRLAHPLGLPVEWSGPPTEWRKINIRILEGAIARLKARGNKTGGCSCPECRGVEINLDQETPDIEGTAPATLDNSYQTVVMKNNLG